jgi:hypothetical protein
MRWSPSAGERGPVEPETAVTVREAGYAVTVREAGYAEPRTVR